MPNTLASWIACLVAATIVTLALVWARRRRGARTNRRSSDPTPAGFDGINARDFDALVGRAFQRQGYQLVGTGADGHSDLVMRRDRQTFLVLCKHWQVPRVGIEVVHALQRSMNARGASGAFALTTGRFSREAVAFAASANIKLIDGPALRTLLDRAKAAPAHDGGPDTMPAR
jgi:restriction system protein